MLKPSHFNILNPLYIIYPCNIWTCVYSIWEKWCFAIRLVTRCINDFILVELIATIHFQLLCNSLMITTIMACWRHFSSIHQNLTCGTIRIFGWIYKKYWYPLNIMIIHFRWFRLWHVAQSKVATLHINWILETYIYK